MTYEGQAKVAAIVAVGLLIITAAATMAVFLVPIPDKNETIVGQALGTLWSLLGVVVAFFYGTSTGNRKDSDTIAKLAETASVAQTALNPNAKPDVVLEPGQTTTVKADE
jgi:hypothetical protein